MTASPLASAKLQGWPPYARVPSFVPVPMRARRGGWTAYRQAEFIGWLAQTGSVTAAAARVGLTRETAYRLRSKPGAAAFADAWDAVLAIRAGTEIPPRKVTAQELYAAVWGGEMEVRMRRGRFACVTPKACNTALVRLIRNFRRCGRRDARLAALAKS